jgi:hypothetical protein
MECAPEAWDDWITCDNEYAAGNRAAVEAGALNYLNTLAVALRKRQATITKRGVMKPEKTLKADPRQ